MRAPLRTRTGIACLAVSLAMHGLGLTSAFRGFGLHPGAIPEVDRGGRPLPAQAGETFEVPVEEIDRGGAPPAEESPAAQDLAAPSPGEGHRRPTRASRPTATPSASGEAGSGGATFGAVGDRSAVEVATAFTRGFPQAASADASWLGASFGPAGSTDVVITIDESGSLIGARSTGSPSAVLAAGVRRTLALIRARSFVATGRETRLRVTATVSPDQVHDGLHGEVFAIGGSWDRGEGSGFFALAVGRRVDVKVREMR